MIITCVLIKKKRRRRKRGREDGFEVRTRLLLRTQISKLLQKSLTTQIVRTVVKLAVMTLITTAPRRPRQENCV